MSDWNFEDLKQWDDKLSEMAKSYGLDWYPINYEVCDYYEMMGHMSYHGMPSHYQHWSYGKSFERTHQMYNLGMEGLPYELIINSNPSIAYLMKQNPIYLQILIMAHCIGHSDFFKNNRIFKNTRPENVVSKFRNARKRIQSYVEDPSIGLDSVEEFLDVLHTIRFQTNRTDCRRKSREEIRLSVIEEINREEDTAYDENSLDTDLLRPAYDLLAFLMEFGHHFKDWQQDLIEIVRDESLYFIPQIKTKVLNEGWASFWHYKLMNEIELPQKYHLPFLKSHNQVVRPHMGRLNPYHLGFYLFKKIEKESGLDECFFIREVHDDESALRCYLDHEDYLELNLFSYSEKKKYITIDDVADKGGWRKIRDALTQSVGVNYIPLVYVSDISKSGDLILQHDHDGRDIDLELAESVVLGLKKIWPKDVKFFTVIEDEPWEI